MSEKILDLSLPLEEALNKLIEESEELRSDFQLPSIDASPGEIVAVLYEVRPRLDRLEALLIKSLRLKRDILQIANVFIDKHNESIDSFMVQQKNANFIRGTDFTSAKERLADANVSNIETKRDAVVAQSLIEACELAVSTVRYRHAGLKDLKTDLHAAIRAASILSSMES